MSDIIKNLNQILANSYSLYLKTQNYHWNVKGSHFGQLHKLFESQYKQLAEAVDILAERIRALNANAPGGFEEFMKLRTFKDGVSNKPWDEMIRDLSTDHKQLVKELYEGIKVCEQLGDDATADLFVERIREHEHNIWMLDTHLA